jgi:hypothetical protein
MHREIGDNSRNNQGEVGTLVVQEGQRGCPKTHRRGGKDHMYIQTPRRRNLENG